MIEIEKLTNDQELIKDFVESLSKKYDSEYFLKKVKNKEFPIELWNEIANNGYLGIIVPEKYGGGNFGIDDLRVFVGEMAKNGLMSFQLVSQIIVCDIMHKYGNDEQKNKYLPEIISGARCSFAFSEPDAGTNTFNIVTDAFKEEEHYKLSGHKTYITGVKESKYMLVVARTTSNNDLKDISKSPTISLFFVDPKSKGINITPQNIGFRSTSEREEMLITGDVQYDIYFDDVIVPKENLIGKENEGIGYLYNTFNLLKIMIAAMAIGWGKNVLNKAVEYAKKRTVFEDPIGSYQAIQHPMARAITDLELANLANQIASKACDSEEDINLVTTYANVARYVASEAAYEAWDIAMQSYGGYSLDREYGIITLWQPILSTRIIPISNEVILDHFCKHGLGLPNSQ